MNIIHNPRAVAGANNPPSLIDLVETTALDLGKWLSEHPVIQTEDEAREGATRIKRAKLALKDLEAERRGLTDPLTEEVSAIRARYRPVELRVDATLAMLSSRLTAYATAEEARRQAGAAEAKRKAQAAFLAAQDAYANLAEADANAAAGEIGVDTVGAAVTLADAASAAERLARDAQRADRDTKVKFGTGMGGPAISLRSKETLTVVNFYTAVVAMGGPSERVCEAILTDARAWRKEHGELPAGVASEINREI